MSLLELQVPAEATGARLDRFLAERLQGHSRSAIQRLISEGAVLVNGAPRRASHALMAGNRVSVALPEPVSQSVQQPSLSILYEDANLLVVDKPAGLVVHPGAGVSGVTLASALVAMRPDLARAGMDPSRPGIVHRLDRDTSGLVLVARNAAVLAALQGQFRRRQVDKRYLAVVHGVPARSSAAIEAPLGRDPHHRERMAVSAEGREARSEYTVLKRFEGATLVMVKLVTGRTHQIRVHMAAIGLPVVGDRTYAPGRDTMGAHRQMLHAHQLRITHPVTGEEMHWVAPVPEDMQALLELLEAQAAR
ncbi:MAG: RluA family pseudouridine synthase [Anaerolineae bacterium]|jgi:23S rRNA pseudouridine1911/1915/1917 synthase|nr:RluA family pseudouridine synthase [Chloroflexota bacterium]